MLSLKNIGQRLLDSTTLDEKVGNFFRPKTGTLASTGRKWAQELAAKPAPSWIPQQVQQTAQNISDRGGFNRLKQEFTSNPAQFTPLSMKSAAVDTGRKLGSEDLGYGLRGALSLTPFQSAGKLTPKLSAIQQTTAPTTSRQQMAQSLGQTLYGTALTAPLSAGKTVLKSVGNVARNLAVGGTTGALMQGGSDLLTGNFSKDSLKQGALSGLQNSWVLPVTNSLTDAAILKLFPKAGLKITGAGVTDPFKLGKIKEGFGRLLTQSLAQVPAENTAFTFLNQLDDKTKGSFTENWMNNLPGNIVGNILSAGVSGSVNVFSNPQSRKVVTDAMKKTVDEWNTPVTMMGGEKMPMWKYKMMYETKPGFARLDLGVGKDTPKLSVEPVGGDLSQPTPINYSSKTIPIDKIKSVGTKGSYDPTSYEYSKKQLQSGKLVAPIEVRLENGKYVIEDGEHRFKAYKELGIKDIPVKVISPSPIGEKVVAQGGLSDAKPTIKGVTSKSRTALPQNTLVNTQVQTAPMLDTTKQTVKLSKDINVKSSASEPIIPKSATPDEVASTIPQRLDNFINKTLGYSTQTPAGGTKQASAWTRGIRGIENKLTTGVETAMGSENNLVRNAATNLQNFFRGAGMSPERANASMDLRGGIANANERAYNVMDSLYKSLNNDKVSLERINAVLDPELAKTKVKLSDLTDTEKQVYGIIREGLDLVHDTSYANGHISSELYQANKGKYTPRLYEVMELPAEVNKFVTQGSKKINNDLYKQRTETNDWKLENSLNDPVYALGKRLSQVETNSAIKKYTNFLASNQRFISDVERPGFTKLSDSPAYGALSGKYVLNSAAEDLKGFFFANQAVQNLYDVFKAYDRLPIRQLQKKLLTVFNPTTNVGNIVSDQVFGFVTGVDPLTLNKNLIDLKSNPSSFKQLSDYLMSKGITGTDITRSDFVNKLSSIDELAKGKKPGVIKSVTDKITSFYGGTDDAYKVAAFKSLLNKGFSLEEATRKVADGFQNYSNVGKFYDVWAKTPIVGSAFIKFQGDLMRIIKNGAVNNPLGLISFLGTLWGVARLSSKLSGESDSDREARENRFGAPMIPGLKIPLTWQTPMGEINAARYISPFFANNEVTNVAKMLPFVPTINTKKDVASNIAINANDPLLSPAINLLVNRDFRGKAIADPNENKYQPSTLTSGEQNLNRLKFAGRAYTPPPINSLIDVKAAAEGKPNMYGSKQSVPQAVARLAGIKVQKYGPEEVQAQKAKDAEFAQYANESIQKQINSVYKQELLGEITPAQKEARIKALEGQKKTVDLPVEKEVKTTDKTTGFADIPAYRYIDDNGAMQTIDITKPLDTPKLTGQTEVDKKLVSAYKGKITSRINDIVKLVEAGKIEPTKAEEMIKTLKATQSKLSGGKKPKKITIKTTKAPRVSFKLAKPTKMSVIKAPTSKRARISFKNYKPAKIRV